MFVRLLCQPFSSNDAFAKPNPFSNGNSPKLNEIFSLKAHFNMAHVARLNGVNMHTQMHTQAHPCM